VHIKHGVRFSPPVNREVTSADVAYAIERGANPNVANPYFGVYFALLVGAQHATGGPIAGIQLPDRYTIVFHLVQPYGSFFVGALTLPLSAPVPREFAAPFDAKTPTQYGSRYLVATGPYMVRSDSTGNVQGVGYRPGVGLTLVRNPNWSAATDRRPAYLDRIEIKIGGDPTVSGTTVLATTDSVFQGAPAPQIAELAYKHYHGQLVVVPGAALEYAALDNAHGPFANVNARRALWAELDREELVKVMGGPLAGQVGTHFIYPGNPGYGEAGGDAGPQVDYNAHPAGDPQIAAKYMRLAGYPSGRGHATVTVFGFSIQPYANASQVVNQDVRNLGFNTKLVLLDPAAIQKYCARPAAHIDVCPTKGWIRDFADSQTILAPIFAGFNITAVNSPNWGEVNNPTINAAIRAAQGVIGSAARASAWAQIDRMLVANAVAVPWLFARQANIRSRDVRGVNDLWNAGDWDYSYTSLIR
jgi:peptide/nickel transport system substrate-binding protein